MSSAPRYLIINIFSKLIRRDAGHNSANIRGFSPSSREQFQKQEIIQTIFSSASIKLHDDLHGLSRNFDKMDRPVGGLNAEARSCSPHEIASLSGVHGAGHAWSGVVLRAPSDHTVARISNVPDGIAAGLRCARATIGCWMQ